MSIFSSMKINHFYRCFGCGREHDDRSGAVFCCAVVQEIFTCGICSEEFSSREQAERHWREILHEIAELDRQQKTGGKPLPYNATGQSFAAGWNNFSTP